MIIFWAQLIGIFKVLNIEYCLLKVLW